MKKISTVLAAGILAANAMPVVAESSLTANGGFVSEYYYRGVNLGDAALNGGVDYENSGFSVGLWAIDDGGEIGSEDGLEYDIYGAYGFEAGGVGISVGFTNYRYTYTSDEEFEINIGLSYGAFSFDYAVGDDKNEEDGLEDDGMTVIEAEDYDYDFFALSWGGEVYGVTIGQYDNDVDDEYKYAEISASGELSGFDVTALIGTRFDAEAGGEDENDLDGYMVLSVSKSFDL